MKKHLLLIFGAAALSFTSIAQSPRDPNLIPCATFEAMDEAFKTDPTLKARFESIQAQFEIQYQAEINRIKSNSKVALTTYTIPVVFHVMGPLVATDQVFINLISYINRDFAKLGSDVPSINPAFASLYVDSEIKFALAQRDPTGKCTNGIIRHNSDNPTWSQTSPAYNYSGAGANRWPTNQYLNIYIVNCISSATQPCPPVSSFIGGYTYLPGQNVTNSSQDAIVLLVSQLAQSNPLDSRTVSHEIGHWLNLYHTFGSTNNPGSLPCGNSGLNDFVGDTPETIGYFSTCPSTFAGDCTPLPNIENIMDYASCPKMFTQGQTTRMRTALQSTTSGRNNLWSAANYSATGISGSYTCNPVADFTANKLANCLASNTITFTSTSYVGASGSLAWTFQGGTPSTSTASTQVVTYVAVGTYSVGLVATNSSSTSTMNKTSYINIVNGAGGISAPSLSDFDGASLPSSITVTNPNGNAVAWIQNTVTGGNGTPKSIWLNNASVTSTPAHIDYFETPIYNFSSTTGVSLSYYYAYAKRTAAQADTFKIQYSLDCGGTWVNVLGVTTTAAMATASGGTTTTAFVPTNAQFISKTIVSGLLSALNNKPSVKFRFWFKSDVAVGRSNNMYLDQINITGNVVTGISELEKNSNLTIYPNPTAASSTLDFTISKNQLAKISVLDVMGRELESSNLQADNDGHVIHTINKNAQLASGVYIINIDVNNQRISKKLVVQ